MKELLSKLTINAAMTLKNRNDKECGDYLGKIYTGTGKWTTLAANGVFKNLKINGLAEERRPFGTYGITSLGKEVSCYLREHWDEVYDHLRKSNDTKT